MRALVVFAMLGAGCTSLRDRAETAYTRGEYLRAVALYDQILARDPADRAAIARRSDARNAALRRMLAAIERAPPDAAATQLTTLLDQRDAWRMTPGELAVAPRIASAVAATTARLGDRVDDHTRAEHPLVAGALLQRNATLLAHADFAATRDGLRARVTAAGRARCERLAAETATEAYWTWLVDRYCAHWGASPLQVPALPYARSDLVLAGAIAGETAGETAALHATLAGGFRETAWFAPNAAAAATGTVEGLIATAHAAHPIALSKQWSEEVAYTDTETVQVSYEEPYEESESYIDQVPTTEYQGSDSTPTTVYHGELKWRTVTKHRTAYRDEQRSVTKYRTDWHTYDYAATERTSRYASVLALRIDGLPEPVVARAAIEFTKSGIDHDVTFTPASIVPQRANLPSHADFATAEHARLRAQLVRTLDERYAKLYCTAAHYSREAAAACAYRDAAHTPPPVRAALRASFGDDEPLLAPLLVRR